MKLIHHAIRMAAFNTAQSLARAIVVGTGYARANDEAHALIGTALAGARDIVSDQGTLHVRLDPLPAPGTRRSAISVSRTLSGAQRIPALTCSMAAMIPGVSQPEVQRQVRQQRADIDALYELVERVDQKVDALDIKLDRRFDEISGQLSDVLRQLGGR